MFQFRLKGEDTNLQYIFQSVPRSQRYPLGVKTNYRAYVQDHVYELIQKHDSSNPLCLGLEPWLTHVHSFPTDEQPPLNILIDVPFGAMFLHGYKLGSAAKLPAAIQSFIRAYPANTEKQILSMIISKIVVFFTFPSSPYYFPRALSIPVHRYC